MDRLNAVHWPPPATPPQPEGEFCFELAGGDVVFGALLALDDKSAEIDVPRIGRTRFQRSAIHRIYRWKGSADLIYLGPNGLTGWQETLPARPAASTPVQFAANGQPITREEPPPPQKGWREESGQLVTDQEGASIQGDFGIPDRAAIEFEISWKSKPDFVLALGVNVKDSATIKRAFRFEAWGGDLVVQRELEAEADLAVVQELRPGAGRAHLQVYLDQSAGRLLVFSQSGKQLASLKVGGAGAAPLTGLYLSSLRGDLRLEWLRIGRWSGELPREVKLDQSRIHQSDGTIVYGQVTSFDAGSGEFVVRGPSGESRIARDKMSSVFLSLPAEEKPRSIRAVCLDGTRLSGDLLKVENGDIVLRVPAVDSSPRIPIAALRSLVLVEHANDKPLAKGESTGRLELDGARLPGRLVDGRSRPMPPAWCGSHWRAPRPARLRPARRGGSSTRSRPPRSLDHGRSEPEPARDAPHGCGPAAPAAAGRRRHGAPVRDRARRGSGRVAALG